jgi:hypothetical protein
MPESDEQFPVLANVGVPDDALDFVDVLGAATLTVFGVETVVDGVLAAVFLVVFVGVLEPPHPAATTATTTPNDSNRKRVPPRPCRAGFSRSMIPSS